MKLKEESISWSHTLCKYLKSTVAHCQNPIDVSVTDIDHPYFVFLWHMELNGASRWALLIRIKIIRKVKSVLLREPLYV